MSKTMPEIKQVIYSDPVTVVIWGDGTKTKSRCDEDDIYDELTGFMLCVFKKLMTPKAMRKMFKDYVYNVDSKKIKWQSEPTWLEEKWADEFVCSLSVDDEYATKCFKEAFCIKDETLHKRASYNEVLGNEEAIKDLVNDILDNVDGGIYVF